MFNISDTMIESLAAGEQALARGLKYYSQNRVSELEINEDMLCAAAVVQGSASYGVAVSFSPAGEVNHMYCDCPAFYQYAGACKHIVAMLMALQRRTLLSAGRRQTKSGQSGSRKANRDPVAENMLNYFEHNLFAPEKVILQIETTLEISYERSGGGLDVVPAVSLRIGTDKLYVVKNLKRFLAALDNRTTMVFGKNFTFDTASQEFQANDQQVIDLLYSIYEMENTILDDTGWYAGRFYHQGSVFKGKQVFLTPSAVRKLFDVLGSGPVNLKLPEGEYAGIPVVEQDLPVQFMLAQDGSGLLLQMNKIKYVPLVKTGEYVFFEQKVHKLSRQQREYFNPLATALAKSPGGIRLQNRQRMRFVTEVLPAVKKVAQVEIAPEVQESIYQVDLTTEIYLDREDEAVTARVDFVYGQIKINPFGAGNDWQTGDKILVRDLANEQAIFNLLEKADFRTVNGLLYLREEEKIYTFVYHILPEMQALAEVYYSEEFRSMRVKDRITFTGGVRLNEDSGMLDFSFDLDGIDFTEIDAIRLALREKKRYYRLPDGSFLPLDNEENQVIGFFNLLDDLNISQQELTGKMVSLPRSRAVYMDGCLREAQWQVERNLAFKQLVQSICEPQDMDFVVPTELRGVLREYQRTGYKWLKTLARYGLGGILADDMGLGKTIQTLAFILSEKEQVQRPSLVVAPTSVVYNWQDEAVKFAPSLKVVVVAGSIKERRILLEEAKEADLVVTSYALLRRDVELYVDFNFGYCFLDEAQNIKNPGSLNAKAAKAIKARGYFALTGTPIENSLTELWSIFDFILPGYLLTHQKFVKKYERPIVKNQDAGALHVLQKQIAPFILRRMKKNVLQELPPKIESKVPAELTTEQKKLYLAYLQQAKAEVDTVLTTAGFERSQIKILALLTRLRQICCHPAIFLEHYQGGSGKLIFLQEFLQDALAGGHRVLLFSQFVGMLQIIRRMLEGERIEYLYLDGATKAEERRQMVQVFNRGVGDVFLISLKAGGTGLNLTGADMVIHYDPWWNPAVEEQATDRSYRIGQKNTVQAISLITRGTIEEKIYELQQKKKAMLESVITPGETMLSKLTEQEVRELFDMA